MKYLLLIYSNESARGDTPPEAGESNLQEWFDYTKALQDSGHYIGGDALESVSTATSVTRRSGERVVTDGPFAETTEQLGGYYLIDVPDKATAVDWAAKCPGARYGTMEVRPLMVFPEGA